MRKAVALVLFFCLFAGMTVSAEKKPEPLSAEEIFTVAQKSAVSLEAVRKGGSSLFLCGVVVEGDSKSTTIATSLNIVSLGFEKFYLHFEKSKARKKSKKITMDFEHNLLFLTFSLSSKYGNFGLKKLPISVNKLALGDSVYVVRAIPGSEYPAQVYKGVTSNEIRFKDRDSLFGIHLNLSENIKASLLGAPVLDKFGTVIGIMNTDINEELFPRDNAYTQDVLIHPGKGIRDGSGKKDKFPKRKGLQIGRGNTGRWLPVRFGPLTPAWRESLDLSKNVFGAVVTYKYPSGSVSLRLGDVVTHIDGFPLSAFSWIRSAGWDVGDNMTAVFMRYNASGGSVKLKIIRDGKEEEVSVTLAQLELSRTQYVCQKLDLLFLELNEPLRISNDFPEKISGIIPISPLSGNYNIACIKGLFQVIVRQVNGKTFKDIDEFRTIIEGFSVGDKARFLVLDLRDFVYKYVTLTIEK